MRNLKKILALVLALMMVLSMMVTASALDFVDAAEIENTEAVSVMAGLGILSGNPTADGNYKFNPNGTLTRGQAAKILAYIVTGDDAYVKEVATHLNNPFTDSVGHWAEPYIAYCFDAGLISGKSATTFDPNGTLSGYALGKLMLCAAGIGEKADYEGDGWEVNVFKALKTNNLLTGVSVGRGDITREDACQLAWNVMNWSPAGVTVEFVVTTEAGVEVYRGTDALIASLVANINNVVVDTDEKSVGSLADTVFALRCNNTTDSFGRVTKTYTSNVEGMSVVVNNDSSTGAIVAKADATVTDAATLLAAINGALNLTGEYALTGTPAMYLNGKVAAYADIKKGDTIELYTYQGALTKVVVIRESVGQAVLGPEITEGTNKGLYNWTVAGATTVAAKDAYVVDAYYTVIKDNNTGAALSIEVPNPITNAKITGADNATLADATYVTVNGEKLQKAGTFASVIAFNTAYDYFLNSNGYLLAVVAHSENNVAEAKDWGYAYLLDAAVKVVDQDKAAATLLSSAKENKFTVDARAVLALANGETVQVNLSYSVDYNADGAAVANTMVLSGLPFDFTNNGTKKEEHMTASGKHFDGWTWVKYEIEKDGTYTLSSVVTDSVALTKGNAAVVTGKYATSKTVWTNLVFNTATKTVTTTEKVGIANFVTDTYAGVVTANTANATLIDAIATFYTYTPDTTSNTTYAYYAGHGDYDYAKDSYTHKFYIDGEVVEYYAAGTAMNAATANSVYVLTMDTGVIESITWAQFNGTAAEVTLIDESFIVAGGETLYLAPGCVVFNVATGHVGEADTLTAATAAMTGDVISYVNVATGDHAGKVAVIYITTEAAAR